MFRRLAHLRQPSFLLRACLVLVAYALLLPGVGPISDHHFVERLPDHLHVYPGGIPVPHIHPYETAHRHDATPGETAPSSGIVFLPPQDEGAPAASVLAFVVALLTAAVVLAAPPLRRQAPGATASASTAHLPPPEPPPPRPNAPECAKAVA